MQKARPKFFKLLIISSLLVVICLVLLLSGISPLVVFISVSVLGLLLWSFTRSTPPEGGDALCICQLLPLFTG